MPMGSSICIVSVHVQAIRLDFAISTPGSNSRLAMATYSSHQPSGTDEWRKASRPSRVERQSDAMIGKRAAASTDRKLGGKRVQGIENLAWRSSLGNGVRELIQQRSGRHSDK